MDRILLFIVIGILTMSCKSSQPATTEEELLISMEKMACMGSCPVYTIKIFKSGMVKLHAEQHLPMKGKFRAELEEQQLQTLIHEFKAKGFFAFEDAYTSQATDLPTTYIEFHYNDQSKKITDYHQAPEGLKELEIRVAALIKELEWEEVEE